MKKCYSWLRNMSKFRQEDILIAQGKIVPKACKEIEISQQSCYRGRKKYGGMSPDINVNRKIIGTDMVEVLRYVADCWRMDYNHYRLHSGLDYMAPAAFAAKCDILL